LSSHKLGDGYTVHLVIKSSARGPQEPQTSASAAPTGNAAPNPSQPNPNQRKNRIIHNLNTAIANVVRSVNFGTVISIVSF